MSSTYTECDISNVDGIYDTNKTIQDGCDINIRGIDDINKTSRKERDINVEDIDDINKTSRKERDISFVHCIKQSSRKYTRKNATATSRKDISNGVIIYDAEEYKYFN